jgi:hypothetical protein
VVRLSLRAVVLGPIRGSLSVLGLVAALLIEMRPSPVMLAWAVGAGIALIVFWGDPRGRHQIPPEPLPIDASSETAMEIARRDVFPSTVTVGLLAAVTLAFDRVLAAFLAGILGGMALMTVATLLTVARMQRRLGGTLYVERKTKRLFVAPKDRP